MNTKKVLSREVESEIHNFEKKSSNSKSSQQRIWSSTQELFNLLQIENPTSSSSSLVNYQHVSYKSGERICSAGEQASSLFVVYFGFLKTSLSDEYGDEKVLNFPMRGDLLGLDSLTRNKYQNDVTSLSDVELIIVPNSLNSFQGIHGSLLAEKLLKIFCRELSTSQHLEHIISKLTAEARVAKFLISLGKKYGRLGFSENSYNLLMTRSDIGSCLGLTLTTVSRILSEFSRSGIVTVRGKSVQINDQFALKRLRHISAIRSCKLEGDMAVYSS